MVLKYGKGRGYGHSNRKTQGQSVASAPAWTPANLTTQPAFWFDARTSLAQSAGALTTWGNRGTQGGNLAPLGTAPTVSATGWDGTNPAVTFNGTSQSAFIAATANLIQPFAMIAVMKSYSNVGGNLWRSSGGLAVSYVTGGAWHMYGGADLTLTGADNAGAACIREDIFNGASSEGRRDGTSYATGSAGTQAAVMSGQNLNIACNEGGGGFYNMTVAEILWCASPSAGELQKLEGYLAWRWGIQANLPVGHPYKSVAP